jgi:ABC-type phosphonate transport system ATPase subunit
MANFELKGITKTFGTHTALKNLSLEVADGEFFVLLGQTGAGRPPCAFWRVSKSRIPVRYLSMARRSMNGGPPSATSLSFCSNIRSTRAIRCGRTWHFR